MHEGHEGGTYESRAILTGIFNRLGDGKGDPLKCKPPTWLDQTKVKATKEELALAKEAFRQYSRQRGG